MTDDFQITPPLLDDNPSSECGFTASGKVCGRPAIWHIFWTTELENSAACHEHYEEARRSYAWYTSHPTNDACISGEGRLVFLSTGGDSTCIHPSDADELVTAAAIGDVHRVDVHTGRLVPEEVPVTA